MLLHCKSAQYIQKIHAQIVTGGYEQNPYVAAKLIGKYTECCGGDSKMEDARKVFDNLFDRDVFSWNMIIQGYANLGPYSEAVNIYNQMRFCGATANRYTFPFVMKACGAMRDGKKGQLIHGHLVKCGFDTDLFVANALVAFYARCQEIDSSRRVFDKICHRDIVSWNSLISGYTVNGYANEAIEFFRAMLRDFSCAPDNATFVGILPACAEAAAIQVAFWIHSYIIKSGMEVNAALSSGLISVYANCGHINMGRDVFDRAFDKNIAVWNAIIRCYGMHGFVDEALRLFSQLVEVGLRPDGVIFVALLSACSHAGKVMKGWEIFEKMENYGVKKTSEHYACMIDILGRAGRIDEALEFIKKMPLQAGKDAYGALLGACRIHNNINVAEEVAEKLFVLDPDNAGRYIIMAKMYEDAGRREDAARLRKALRQNNIRKPFGYSSIQVDSIQHTFRVNDEYHPLKEKIFDTLERLNETIYDKLSMNS
ncbi:PPR domain-containing protein/PPR_2 domain-containing protein [Cephalotus follicularis]|uniref:PPR domain-containing protein/PPR_2 domain-containing protein n=1 Tax=Cephalotus follicularis TaxID=3775 RepID=A0A1Q3CER0_CEPFO|nr:PPR domain-containing protein/PPR_2 domain-containing protein [Cephalotus follicularis]